MADTPAQASLRAAFDSKLSVIPQTLNSEQQTQAQTNMGGPFLPLTGGTVAGTITATGFSGPLTGNASTASAWETSITMTVSGDATGSVSIDGSDNATLNLAIGNSSVTNAMLAASSVTFSKVASGDVATQAEAESGTANNSFMTPLRVAQAIAARGSSANAYVVETYHSGTSWYRIWSDGWIEQGGHGTGTACTFLKPFTDKNYTFNLLASNSYIDHPDWLAAYEYRPGRTTSSTGITQYCGGDQGWDWRACGY